MKIANMEFPAGRQASDLNQEIIYLGNNLKDDSLINIII